jgi:hypothetical protein
LDGAFVIVRRKASSSSIDTLSFATYKSEQLTTAMFREVELKI